MPRAFLLVVLLTAPLASAPAAAQVPPHSEHPPAPSAQQPVPKPATEDHSAHTPPKDQAGEQPKQPIPPLTDADRAAAFPPALDGHAVHDRQIHSFVLFDQLEWQGGDSGGANVENTSWIGGDINRLWLRAEAETEDGDIDNAFVDALWGRSFSRWWDVVAGVRQDFRPGDPQTWAAVGVQGLAPYWFDIEATAYVGPGGRTHARFEAEYDLLLTNRLVLQPLLEVTLYGKDDPERGIGSGLSSVEAGLRLRYEIRRELAPYVGVVFDRSLRGTADYARENGDEVGTIRLAVGLRTWF